MALTAFRMKLSELCKTKSKKSNPDMFKLYVVLTSHDTVTVVGRAPILGAISTPLDYQQKVQKMKNLPKTWFLTEKQFEDFRRKKTETIISTFQKKNPMENKEPYRYQSIMALVNSKS